MNKVLFAILPLTVLSVAPAAPPARPSPQQIAYQDMELQMFLCLDPCAWQGREYDNHSTPLSQINPDKLDAEQWCRAAKSFGAGQILFVAKHTGGFCWWRTETSKYGIKETPYKGGKGDLLAEVSAACRKHGLKLGIYVYPGDDQWGATMGGGGKTADPKKQEAYNRVFRQQMTEVLSNYGPVAEVWFDGSCVIEVGDIMKKHCPDAMVFQGPYATLRWVGNEAGYAPYPAWNAVRKADAAGGVATAAHGTPDGDVWMPLEVDTVLHEHFWFWKKDNERARRGVEKLMDCYYKSVGRGAVLLLNSCPATDGLIPEGDLAVYEAFGKEIQRRFSQAIAETKGEGETVELDLGKPTPVNHVITMEDIAQGERVRAYRLEGLAGTQWKALVAGGISIGHKKIDPFPRQTLSRIRLVVTKSADRPVIRRLAAFNVEGLATSRPMVDAAWAFDEGAGDVLRAARADWPGKLVGAAWAEGHAGKCLDFRKRGDHVSLGNVGPGDGDFTVAAWIFPRSIPMGQARIVAKERINIGSNQFRLYVHEGGRLGFAMTDTMSQGPGYPFATAPGSVPLNAWTHVAVTRQGTELVLYVNGKASARTRTEGVIEHANSEDLRIGASVAAAGSGGDYAFDGLLDDVRLYARALSAAELANPDKLPEPGWKTVVGWDASTLTAGAGAAAGDWKTWTIDLTPGIAAPGEFELDFRQTGGEGSLEIKSVEFLVAGKVLDGRAKPMDALAGAKPDSSSRFHIYRMEQTTADTPSTARVTVRWAGGKACSGEVRIRSRVAK